jgi:hypothetical protein
MGLPVLSPGTSCLACHHALTEIRHAPAQVRQRERERERERQAQAASSSRRGGSKASRGGPATSATSSASPSHRAGGSSAKGGGPRSASTPATLSAVPTHGIVQQDARAMLNHLQSSAGGVNAVDGAGWSCLHWAALLGKEDHVAALLDSVRECPTHLVVNGGRPLSRCGMAGRGRGDAHDARGGRGPRRRRARRRHHRRGAGQATGARRRQPEALPAGGQAARRGGARGVAAAARVEGARGCRDGERGVSSLSRPSVLAEISTWVTHPFVSRS